MFKCLILLIPYCDAVDSDCSPSINPYVCLTNRFHDAKKQLLPLDLILLGTGTGEVHFFNDRLDNLKMVK